MEIICTRDRFGPNKSWERKEVLRAGAGAPPGAEKIMRPGGSSPYAPGRIISSALNRPDSEQPRFLSSPARGK